MIVQKDFNFLQRLVSQSGLAAGKLVFACRSAPKVKADS